MTDYYDSGREREFNTYYDAYRALSTSDPPYTDLYDAEAAARHKPQLASDPALTAFCQLGALRLNTKRCMIFFFDQKNGYVLAESTQSHHSGHAQELWLGNTIIPRGLSVCEHTVNIPEGNQGSNRHEKNAGEVHVINDFLEDRRFCDRPYVRDAPRARFYAGVPIATPSGARIGAYCVLDDAPRDGVNDEDVDFLKHMASLVMRHLGVLRESAEYGRGARMLQGLGVITRHDENSSPVEGMADRIEKANVRRKLTNSNLARSSSPPSSYTPMLSEYVSDFAAETDSVRKDQQKAYEEQSRSASEMASSSHVSANERQPARAARSDDSNAQPPPLLRAPPSDESGSSYHTDGNVNNTLDKQIRQSFQRASSLLLDAVKSDGVVFLDATAAKSANNRVTSRRFTGSSDRSTSESDGSNAPEASSVVNSGVKCDVLGHSEMGGVGSVPSFDNMITERFLKSLMRRYPKGKTWTFDADGKESSEKFLQDLAASVPQADDVALGDISRRLRETPKLQRLFSLGLRTLCFAPMWDPVRERWYAAALTWSKSPQHGFSKTSELSYLNAFCDVTMAEILRIESKQEARSRAALMSSFSHDLRSPLHGILGSIDLLKGAGTLDWSLVEQVQKCSLNLVDVIDHLLDFAQINNKATARRPSDDRHEWKVGKLRPPNKTSSQCVSLSRTTEAIVDAVFYSHYFTKQDRTQPHVDLVMDLTPRSAIQCMISVGAWKRLCTNIVNNALKYTPKGHVRVSLDVSDSENGKEDRCAILTVSDTGIGMSQEFLQESLFKSFAQEDSFATGTGLGMSLVAELIKEFGGQIEVTSKKGEGTTMAVTIPLDVPLETTALNTGSEFDCSDVCVGYYEPHEAQTDTSSSRHVLIDAAKHTLRDLGVTITAASDTGIVVILEEHFTQLQHEQKEAQRWLVLCDSFASATRLREQYQGADVEFVPQPYGPERLYTALQTLCKSLREQVTTTADSDPTVSGAIDRQRASLVRSRGRAMSALPSPPLDVALEYLTLSSPNASTLKITAPEADAFGNENTAHTPTPAVAKAVVKSPPATTTPHNQPPSPAQSSQQRDPLFLLLVDDNPINLKLLAMVADRNNYPRILATNGQEAVEAYKSPSSATRPPQQHKVSDQQLPHKRPDVVLLDLNMPIMNGFEAARQIRQYEKQSGVVDPAVIVAITGLGDDIARAKAYQHGFDLFMSKPVRPKDVTDMLEAVVKERKDRSG